jgi:hypothetical protein
MKKLTLSGLQHQRKWGNLNIIVDVVVAETAALRALQPKSNSTWGDAV